MLAREAVAPRYLTRPVWSSSAGGEVADLAAQAGLVLDAEQRLILDVMFAERGDRWAAREVAVILPRQTGKTVTFEAACLGDLFLYGGAEQLVIWTAHLFPTANEAFIDLKALIEGSDFLSRRVRRITEAAGNQGIELLDGTRLKFLARSKSGGRGFSGSKVYLDEGFALSPAEIGSLLPTLSAQPDPQVVYGSSAGRLDSEVLRRVRDRGRAGDDPSLAYIEWCAEPGDCAALDCWHLPGVEGCVYDDRERWRQANPTVGIRIEEDFIASERLALTPVEFARERLGWWEDPPAEGADNGLPGWAAAGSPTAAPAGRVRLGVCVSHDGRTTSIVAGDGRSVEVVEWRAGAGTAWLRPRLDELLAHADIQGPPVVLAGSAAASIADSLGAEVLPSARAAAACQAFAMAVNEGRLSHRTRSDGADTPLGVAVRNAVRLLSGDGWRWSLSRSTADISPLLAAVAAHHAASAAGEPYDPLTNFMPNL